MKLVDKLIGKIGTDKALHFLVGALVTSYGSMVGDACMWTAVVLVFILSIAKETLDEKYDIEDIVAGVLGLWGDDDYDDGYDVSMNMCFYIRCFWLVFGSAVREDGTFYILVKYGRMFY